MLSSQVNLTSEKTLNNINSYIINDTKRGRENIK